MALRLLPKTVADVAVIVPKERYEKLVESLVAMNLFHPIEPGENVPGVFNREYRRTYTHVSDRVSRLERYMDVLRFAPKKPQREIVLQAGSWQKVLEEAEKQYKFLEEEFDAGVRTILEAEARIAELEEQKRFLELLARIAPVELPGLYESRLYSFILALIDKDTVEELFAFASERMCLYTMEEWEEDTLAFAAVCTLDKGGEVAKRIGELGGRIIKPLEGLPGNPAEALEIVSKRIEELTAEVERVREKLLAKIDDISDFYHISLALREAYRILAHTRFTERTAVLRGYLDSDDLGKFEKALRESTGNAYVLNVERIRRAHMAGRPPSKVELPWILKPFHKIVRMYGEPDANEVIPTVFLAITMPVTFALMFPDLGHGLLVFLFAYMFYKKALKEDSRLTWQLVMILGAASMVSGFLAGEFFGPMTRFAKVWEAMGFEFPPLASPLFAVEHGETELLNTLVVYALTVPLVVAGIMLILGTFLGVVNAFLKGEVGEALATRIPKFILFTIATMPFVATFNAVEGGGIIKDAVLGGMQTTPGKIVGILGGISFLWLILGEPVLGAVKHGAAGLKHGLSVSFMETFETVLMLLGNIPSFLRIMGLSLAHASLMYGFTILTELVWHGVAGIIFGIVLYVIGNLMTAGLEAIIAFAHSLRLHFYEWFSKFYSGRGIPFQPATIPTGVQIRIIA